MIYLICGAPGSGKTWVAKQLADKATWVPHDKHAVGEYYKALLAADGQGKQVIGEAPFRASVLIGQLQKAGAKVQPIYISEPDSVIAERYAQREGKPIPTQHLRTNARYASRAPKSSSSGVLKALRAALDGTLGK